MKITYLDATVHFSLIVLSSSLSSLFEGQLDGCCWKKPFFKTWVTALSGALCVVCRKEDHLSQFLTTSVCNQYFYEALILSLSTGIFLLREYLNDFLSHLFRMIVFVIFLF